MKEPNENSQSKTKQKNSADCKRGKLDKKAN